MKKEYHIYSPSDIMTKYFLAAVPDRPKKVIGCVVCIVTHGDFIKVAGYSFCSHHDEWDENVGKRIATERVREVLKKL